MEKINGVSFEDWASACGNIAKGMPESNVLEILGVELPVWQETSEKWAAKLGDLMTEDMSIATTYGEIFANPARGKFAAVAGSETSLDDLLTMVPDYDAYWKIFSHQSAAAAHGYDPVGILQEYGLNLGTWGTLNMHYMNWRNEFSDQGKDTPLEKENFDYLTGIHDKWDNHYKEFYASESLNLGEDIDF